MTTSLDHDELTVGTDRIRFRLTSCRSGGEVAVIDVTIPAGGGPPMLHRHDPFELYRVRSGRLAIYVESDGGRVRRIDAGPGAVVPIAPGLEHTVRNESDGDAEATVIFTPGEPMERFARAAAEAAPEEVPALAGAHGIEVTRPIGDALVEAAAGSGTGYLTIARFSGDGERLLEEYRSYSEAMSEVGRDHGLIAHAGARTEDGLLVVNLWPSKDGSEAAARDPRRLQVIERTAIDPDQVRREHHDGAHFILFG
ncbi:MAG TPA: cupin domain-containing protein [Thermoleophilaceae bacterium]|jgi:mannose-6-phosphate isomerase-like protein (cupin superfamily)